MPAKTSIQEFNHFNQSLHHLHLPSDNKERGCYVFKWNYTEDRPIIYPVSRQTYFDITFFVEATFTHYLNADAFPMCNHSLHILTPGQAEQFETTTLQRKTGYGIYCTPAFLFETTPRQKIEKELPFLKNGFRNVFYFSPAQSLIIQQLFETMLTEQSQKQYHIVAYYLLILLHKINDFAHTSISAIKQGRGAGNALGRRFESLLKQHYLDQNKVSWYANMLQVTTRQLTEALQQETGKTPKQLMQELILLDAKMLLLHSDLRVSEIAWRFQFHDVPHFTRFFTKVTGLTPQQFRKANR
jgi:AraC family transcriptional regulator, transcriptional activator of pobA